jgi:hypothetical protein
MTARGSSQADPLIAPSALRADAACDRFEAAWYEGGRPRIEDYLAGADGEARRALLGELLMLEIELARAAGESPTPEAYRARFPGEDALIDTAFSASATVRRDPGGSVAGGAAAPRSACLMIGRFVVLGRLKEGGQGVVYRVVHPELGEVYALKWSRRTAALSRDKADRVADEARLLVGLHHPNLVRVVDLDVHDGRPFLVMEYVPGLNLPEYAGRTPPTPRRAAALVAELARAAGYLHRQGVVHQDIKPQNVLIDDTDRPRLIDLGLARLRDAWSDAAGKPSGGTLAYMAPEQAEVPADRVNSWTDVFGLGAVLYELLTGRPPYRADTTTELEAQVRAARIIPPRRLNRRVPRGLDRICLKALARAPEDRYPAGDHLDRALRRWLRRRAVAAVALAVALTLGLAGWALTRTAPPAASPEVLALDVSHFSEDRYVGDLGAPSHTGPVTFDDDVKVCARLSAPAFCYLLALNTDGLVQILDPDEDTMRPARAAEVVDPSDPRNYLTLNDGAGLQGFVLIASRRPLPAFVDWRPRGEVERLWGERGACRETARAWRFDGRRGFRPLGGVSRGTERSLAVPSRFEAVCRFLRDHSGAEVIHAVAFPVRPRPGGTPGEPSR